MATVRLGRAEAESGALPSICMLCGAPATHSEPRTFLRRRFRPHTPLDSFFDPLMQMTVLVPLCQNHYTVWGRWKFVGRVGCVGILVASILSIALMLGLRIWQPEAAWVEMLAKAIGGMLFLSIIILFVLLRANQPLRSVEITDHSITLRGVCEKFARAVDATETRH